MLAALESLRLSSGTASHHAGTGPRSLQRVDLVDHTRRPVLGKVGGQVFLLRVFAEGIDVRLNTGAGESPLIDVNGVGHVVAGLPLGETQLGERVMLWLMQPLDRTVKGFTAPLLRDFLVYGLLAVALTALGAAVAARSVLRRASQATQVLLFVIPVLIAA